MSSEFEEKREFLRIDLSETLAVREVKANKLSPRSEILTRNVSPSGVLIRTANIPPALSSILWIELDQKMMNICSEIETDLIIRGGGVYGRVVRIAEGEPGLSYDVGVCFLRRKNLTDLELEEILPKIV
ncbi:MAG TPA: hypothetical protein PKY78_08820 [Candidatus Omnitrophota bacterium]|nr:hypothetical protein [Candidatus Omnitrophota bacterium]HPS21072.1 hypothetical protein [Candidatus Omnitrophota bacterium]